MKLLKTLSTLGLALTLLAGGAYAADKPAAKKAKAKPYTLKTCIVTDEKLGGMGDAFVFEHEGQEVKLCCKGCKEDFDKDAKKFMKKIADAGKSGKK